MGRSPKLNSSTYASSGALSIALPRAIWTSAKRRVAAFSSTLSSHRRCTSSSVYDVVARARASSTPSPRAPSSRAESTDQSICTMGHFAVAPEASAPAAIAPRAAPPCDPLLTAGLRSAGGATQPVIPTSMLRISPFAATSAAVYPAPPTLSTAKTSASESISSLITSACPCCAAR